MRLDSFVFYTRYADAIVLSPTSVDGEDFSSEGDRYYHSDNAAFVDYYGLDIHGEVPLIKELYLFGRWLAMIGEQSNQPSENVPESTPADRVPPFQGEAGFRTELENRWSFKVFSRWRMKQDRLNDPVNLDDNRIPEDGTPGYVTFHARSAYALARRATVALALDNITNRLVLEHGSGFYSPGFSATMSLDAEFE